MRALSGSRSFTPLLPPPSPELVGFRVKGLGFRVTPLLWRRWQELVGGTQFTCFAGTTVLVLRGRVVAVAAGDGKLRRWRESAAAVARKSL